ncbi:MAG: glucose 1-dehydrogenase [Chloroflexi bacterium]|nr:glucose 1-dehydrogenase [Chloroflexota bacterium]
MGRVDGKVTIITGGGSGIGRATAELFGREGAPIVVADVNAAGGAATVERIRTAGGRADFVQTDVSVASDVARLIDETIGRYGRIDVLYNNAAVILSKSAVDTTPEEWARVISVNLTGVYLGCHFAIPHMLRQGGGVIVSTASPHAFQTGKTIAAYAAAKGGIVALTKQMAMDYGRHGIRVNCVVPGAIDTPMLRADIQQGAEAEANVAGWAQAQPIGRVGAPEDIARVVLWLATDDAAFVLGAPIIADGGLLAQLIQQ